MASGPAAACPSPFGDFLQRQRSDVWSARKRDGDDTNVLESWSRSVDGTTEYSLSMIRRSSIAWRRTDVLENSLRVSTLLLTAGSRCCSFYLFGKNTFLGEDARNGKGGHVLRRPWRLPRRPAVARRGRILRGKFAMFSGPTGFQHIENESIIIHRLFSRALSIGNLAYIF